jgi:hypothetical protein
MEQALHLRSVTALVRVDKHGDLGVLLLGAEAIADEVGAQRFAGDPGEGLDPVAVGARALDLLFEECLHVGGSEVIPFLRPTGEGF